MKSTLLPVLMLAGTVAVAQDEPGNQTRDQISELRQHWQEIEEIAAQRERTPAGDERDVLNARIALRTRTLRSDFRALLARIERVEADGVDASAERATADEVLAAAAPLIRHEIEHRRDIIAARRNARDETPADQRLELERQLTRDNQELDASLATFLQIINSKLAVSLDTADDEAYLDGVLENRIEDLMARTQLWLGRRDDAAARLRGATSETKPSLEADAQVVRETLHANVVSLEATISMMAERGLDSTAPKELLMRATGNVTTDIFDVQVLSGLFTRTWTGIRDWLVTRGPQLLLNLLLFVLIVASFRLVSGFARKITERAVTRTSAEAPMLLKNMLVSMSGKLVLLLGILIALPQIGIDVGPLLAGVGVAGFIVGFALQDTLSNFASGIMILVYHPFDVGDIVDAGGVSGEVSHMSVVSTTIRTFDNQVLIVPNNKIWGDVIRNKTAVSTRRVDLKFGIGYRDDVAHAERVLRDIVDAHELVLDDPPPTIKLHELGDSSVNFVVRPWVNTQDYWNVYWDITRAVKERFDAEGISIPFPQRDVHVHEASTPDKARAHPEPPRTVGVAGLSSDDD